MPTPRSSSVNGLSQSPAFEIPIESPPSMEHGFLLHPLFTMKRIKQYSHTQKPNLLSQLAKFHYEEDTLDEIIDPALRQQMDPQSFKIFSETAYNCLKEPRAQRPNIDQILKDLERALELQKIRDNPDSSVAGKVEGTSSDSLEVGDFENLKIPITDLKSATKNFDEDYLIGSGGYGDVFKAKLVLPTEEKNKGEISKKLTTVAIKRILIREDKQGEDGFVAEIKLLSSCQHPNIVSLLGFCNESPNMLLVYEHASNGSLEKYLGSTDNSNNLTWVQRIKICIDIAHGLNYLHTKEGNEDEKMIIHHDIKSANILLGKNLVAKIADFGLSRFHEPNKQSKTFMANTIGGTKEYICPEYRNTGRTKRAIDIYSLGVVFFEILSGNLAGDTAYTEENEYGIAYVARKLFEEGSIDKLVDPRIAEEVDELASTLNKGPNKDALETFSNIAHRCIAETQDVRPTAKEVIAELEKALSIQENNKDDLQMTYEDIISATNKFSVIGRGGFGSVYKGEITRGNECKTIAAKQLDKSEGQGELQFLTELEILFEYKHENIICLEGYCNEKDKKIIVYEYASKRSLEKHLKDVTNLTWRTRLKICIDVATGLTFLHGGAPTKEMVIHRDIKCANILLNDDWKAKISDFGLSAITAINEKVIGSVVGTKGYVDPLYEIRGFCTEKSDIYSFGIVLFEILNGQLVVPDTEKYNAQHVNKILGQIHEKKNNDLILKGLRRQIVPESLSTFRQIVIDCLNYDREKRPTANVVLQQLNKALEYQEEIEIWESLLPKDYKEIIQMSKSPEENLARSKKDLYSMLSKGILLQEDKVWFSLGSNGERNEMISAREFSYINSSPYNWRSVSNSRFPEAVEIFDLMNINIKIKTKTHFLSPEVEYGAYLVFKFCDARKFSSKPVYVKLKYKHKSTTLFSYFAIWRDKEWMAIELFRFSNYKEDFEFLLESFSRYYSGDGAIYVLGIEFQPIDNVNHEEIQMLTEVQHCVTEMDTWKTFLCSMLLNVCKFGFFIQMKHEEIQNLTEVQQVDGKKNLMLSAKEALYDSSNVKRFLLKPSGQSRFQEVIELLPQQVFLINCMIKGQMLSQDTEYVCYLVFKLSEQCQGLHCPLKIRDLVRQENEEAEVVYFKSPSPWNIHKLTRAPEQRKDGWMEVNVAKFNSTNELKNDHVHVHLKILSYEGIISGLIVRGLEFRPV